jgi:hypothetical protein
MKLSTFSIIWALIHIMFGIGLLFFPVQFMSQFGVTLAVNITLSSKTLGSVFIALALIYYWNRNIPASDSAQHNILLGSFIFHLIEMPVVVTATLNGTMNAMGWVPVFTHVFLLATFGYFAFRKASPVPSGLPA